MTEAEWMVSEDPRLMIATLANQSGVRKWRVFAIEAIARVLANDFYYPQLEDIVQFGAAIAEDFQAAPWSQEQQIRAELDEALWEMCETLNRLAEAVQVTIEPHFLTFGHGLRVVEAITAAYQVGVVGSNGDEQFAHQAHLLREIFGNPFAYPFFKPKWRTTDVMLLAQGIYDAKAFDRMPILADALQDAGCDSDDILNHGRDTALAHVRGCWVVDAVLGKE